MFGRVNHAALLILESAAARTKIITTNLVAGFRLGLLLDWLSTGSTNRSLLGGFGDGCLDWFNWKTIFVVLVMLVGLDRHLKDGGSNFALQDGQQLLK